MCAALTMFVVCRSRSGDKIRQLILAWLKLLLYGSEIWSLEKESEMAVRPIICMSCVKLNNKLS